MTLSLPQIACIVRSMNEKKDGSPRQFPAIELPVVVSVMGKIRAFADESGQIKPADYQIEFPADERKFVKELINQQDWSPGDAEQVLALIKMLEQEG